METNQPPHLLPFLDGTPLSIIRLKEAWRGLSLSEKIVLASRLLIPSGIKSKKQFQAFVKLATEDGNAYVRYLTIRLALQNYQNWADALLDPAKDPSELVGIANIESSTPIIGRNGRQFPEAKLFWNLTSVQRLATVSNLTEGGVEIAAALRYAIFELLPKGEISETDLQDILLQYVGGTPNLKERVMQRKEIILAAEDGWANHALNRSLTALWTLIPDVPPMLADLLSASLPAKDGNEQRSNSPLTSL